MIQPTCRRVLLIGGTSHTGKSTLAQSLAHRLEWSYITTDKLARHPGRPWRTEPERVPDHVAEHYLSLSVEELIMDVLAHYRKNVWPIVASLVVAHATDPTAAGLVMEGSALWPEWVATLNLDTVAAIWLTASRPFIENRMYSESQYRDKTPREKEMIDKFLERTLVYDQRMMEVVQRLGLPHLDVETASSLSLKEGKSVVEPVAEPRYELEALLAKITEENLHRENW